MLDLVLLFAFLLTLLTPSGAAARLAHGSPQPAVTAKAPAASSPDLAALAPRAAELTLRYAWLEGQLQGEPDFASTREKLKNDQEKISLLEGELRELKASRNIRYAPLSALRAKARQDTDTLTQAGERLTREISRLADLQREWTQERASWQAWETNLAETPALPVWRSTISEATHTTDRALGLIAKAQEPILSLERSVQELQARTIAADTEAGSLLETLRGGLFRRSGPSILSADYGQALRGTGWRALRKSLGSIAWPQMDFLASSGWVALLQGVLALVLCRALLRRRALLGASRRWAFLENRPLAAGLFVGVAAPSPLYSAMPSTWTLLLWTVVSPAAARLVAGLITLRWKRRLLYGLAGLFWLSQAFRVAGLPDPLFRAYVTAVAAVGLPLAFWRARESVRRADSAYYTWALRLGAVVFASVLVAQLGGYSALASHLLEASIETTFLVLLAWTLALLLRGGVEFALRNPPLNRFPLLETRAPQIGRRLGRAVDLFVAALTVGGLLRVWQLYDSPMDALSSLLSAQLAVAGYRFTPGLVLLALVVLYGAFVASWTVQALVLEGTLLPAHLETGARISVARLLHYALVLVGFSLALGALGIDLRNLTILAGAFGIGIGFGLQNIVNNFVSGLILLFERPVKVGDIVQVGGEWGEIKSLGLRSTVIRTYDQSEIIVPNSDLVANRVTNWTLTDRQARIVIPVGVAYGSDVPAVMRILAEIALAHRAVLGKPERQVLFTGFGDSALNFELRVWIGDVMERVLVQSELLQEIDRRFREEAVEIPFPQCDLHLRSVSAEAEKAFARPTRSAAPPGAEPPPLSSGEGGVAT